MQQTVSVIVLNWNRKKYIDPFFSSLANVDIPQGYTLEKIFVDNNSSDDSLEYLEKNYRDIKVVRNNKNYGYAEGNNRGISQATGDFILVTNNDVTFDTNWLSTLLVAAESHKDTDVFVPKLVFANKRKLINNAGSKLMPDSDWPILEIGANQPADRAEFNKSYEITAFCGANVLFRRKFLEEVGLFDKHFFMYFEDGDLSWRGQKLGKKYRYTPDSVVFHEHTGTSTEGSPLFNHYVSRNRILILAKNARLSVFVRGYLKVFRDHVWHKIKHLLSGVTRRKDLRIAWVELWRGILIMFDASIHLPIMMLKRFKILKEQTL